MRPPKQPRRPTRPAPPHADAPGRPARQHAERELPNSRPAPAQHRAVRDQKPESAPPTSDTPGLTVRARVAKMRRERMKRSVPAAPVPTHRKRSSDPYPLSEKIDVRRRAKRRALFIRLAIAAVSFIVLGVAVWLLFFSSVFAVKAENVDIAISDPAGVVDDAQIAEIVSSAEGTPVLRLSAGDLESQILELPEVERAHVAGVFPSGIDVDITAREPVACVGAPDSCVGIAPDATRLDVSQELRDTLPKVTLDLDSDRAADQLQGLLDALAALPGDVRARVQTAAISTSGLIEFSLDSGTIKWGPSEENDKKARIITVLLTQQAGTYDVTVPNAPVTY